MCRIACEFLQSTEDDDESLISELANLLGHLRQAAQYWREQLEKGLSLEFNSAIEPHYVQFKETLTRTSAFMVRHVHQPLNQPRTWHQKLAEKQQKRAVKFLIRVFSNNYEASPSGYKQYKPLTLSKLINNKRPFAAEHASEVDINFSNHRL